MNRTRSTERWAAKRQKEYDAFHAALNDARLRRQWAEEQRHDNDIKRKREQRAAIKAQRGG